MKKKTTKAKPKSVKKTLKKAAPKKSRPSHMPAVGSKAPLFKQRDDQGNIFSLKDHIGASNIVLYFYPRDDTPGCTVEACNFRDHINSFDSDNAIIVGVSADDESSHTRFRKKFSLPFRLLADVDHLVCKAYGVWVEKNMYGRKYMGIARATFLIDKSGNIAGVWPKVKVEDHANQVLAAIANLD